MQHRNLNKSRKPPPTITIDGPTGSGKGTISRLLAKKLGWNFLDSGVLYRTLAYAILNYPQFTPNNLATIRKIIAKTTVTCYTNSKKSESLPNCKVFLQGKNISKKIREEIYSKTASKIASNPLIRKAMLAWQRKFLRYPGLVADGRDMGTIVFPHAQLKIFLTATAKTRAQRRYEQLKIQGINVTMQTVLKDLRIRDRRDVQRDIAPLAPAKNALIIDTTKLSIEEVIEKIYKYITSAFFILATK